MTKLSSKYGEFTFSSSMVQQQPTRTTPSSNRNQIAKRYHSHRNHQKMSTSNIALTKSSFTSYYHPSLLSPSSTSCYIPSFKYLVMMMLLLSLQASFSFMMMASATSDPGTMSNTNDHVQQQKSLSSPAATLGSAPKESEQEFAALSFTNLDHHSLPVKRGRQYSFGLGKRRQPAPTTFKETAEIWEIPTSAKVLPSGSAGNIASLLQLGAMPIATQSTRSDLIYVMAYPAASKSHPQPEYYLDPEQSRSSYMMGNGDIVAAGIDDSLIGLPEINGEQQQIIEAASAASQPQSIESSKRSRPQRFSFGLGKRSKEQVMFAPEDNGIDGIGMVYAQPDNNLVDKRKLKPYGFGLGKKRSPNDYQQFNGYKVKKLTSFEDFIKRRYSFGLGKRSV